MAQKQIFLVEDDIEGGPASHTLRFALEGDEYEIDLNDHNAGEMRDVFAPYVGRGRKLGRRQLTPGRRTAASRVDNRAVRAWAGSNGVAINGRGRIPAKVLEQYHAAGN
jgi:hypothetical protein